MFLALKNATHRISCGQLAGTKIFRNQSFQIVPNAIQIEKFKFSSDYRNEIREEFHIPNNQKVVGMVGILNPFKNQKFLIEIANDLPQVTFLFVGEGPDRLMLEEQSKELENVIFTGRRNDVHKFYSAFDVFAFPSLYEGFPMVLVEAQCSRVNIIMNETIDSTTQINKKLCTALPLKKEEWMNYIEKAPILDQSRPLEETLKPFNIDENRNYLKVIYKQGLEK